MTYQRALPLSLLLLLTALHLTGCDSSDADDPRPGSFQIEVEGAIEDAFSGRAAFATETDPDAGPVFAIGLLNAEGEQDIVVLVGKGNPVRKTYEVSADEAAEAGAFYALHTQAEEGEFYVAAGGTITLTDVRADRLAGRFEIEAISLVDEARTVTISGTFDAERGEVEGGLEML